MFSDLLINYPVAFPIAAVLIVILFAGLLLWLLPLMGGRGSTERLYPNSDKRSTPESYLAKERYVSYAEWDAELTMSLFESMPTGPPVRFK